MLLTPGRYATHGADAARVAAHRLAGTVCLLSAAQLHGWAVKSLPGRPQGAVLRKRKMVTAHAAGVEVRRLDLDTDDVRDAVTTRERTLLDCGRLLPFDEALAVFDSALRDGRWSGAAAGLGGRRSFDWPV